MTVPDAAPRLNERKPVKPALVVIWQVADPPRPPTPAEVDALAGWTVELARYADRAYLLCGPQPAGR